MENNDPRKPVENRSDTELILAKLTELRCEKMAQQRADRDEMQKALRAMAAKNDVVDILSEGEELTRQRHRSAKVPANDILSDEEEPARRRRKSNKVTEVETTRQTFARPIRQHSTSMFNMRVSSDVLQNSADPIARLREDGATAAQAQLILNAAGVSLPELEGTNMRSGFYRNVNDMKLFEVPWPNDCIYLGNGKKATYDTLSIPEFVVGYCNIVIASLPIMTETKIAIDHVGYLSDVMADIEGGEWGFGSGFT